MRNLEWVSVRLAGEGRFPVPEKGEPGLTLSQTEQGGILIRGTADDLIQLADLLVSLALSGENRGQHWHVDELTLLDGGSPVPELILARK